jgi:acetoin utilization protein AcuC
LFPGTGLPTEIGVGAAEGTAVNVALPPGTDDAGWLRAFRAVVPGLLRAFAPDVLVAQCGCDTHHQDPLANLELTIDGQRTAIAALHSLAHEVAGGRWLACGGGGYGLVRCVPRTWTHLLAEASGQPVAPDTLIPRGWQEYVRARGARGDLPQTMGERPLAEVRPWEPGGGGWLDGAIGAARRAVYPLHGLDPDDPRD